MTAPSNASVPPPSRRAALLGLAKGAAIATMAGLSTAATASST
jgi:hypothetical protein